MYHYHCIHWAMSYLCLPITIKEGCLYSMKTNKPLKKEGFSLYKVLDSFNFHGPGLVGMLVVKAHPIILLD